MSYTKDTSPFIEGVPVHGDRGNGDMVDFVALFGLHRSECILLALVTDIIHIF